jgi:hypothetical protein
MINELNLVTGEELPEGLTITASTLKTVYSGLNPITGLAENLLGALSG